MQFKKLGPFLALMIVSGVCGIFFPPLLSLVVAFAAIFVSGVVVVSADYVVREIRLSKAKDNE